MQLHAHLMSPLSCCLVCSPMPSPVQFSAHSRAARSHPAAAQGLRAALNAALFRTGDQSRDFAVVLATNRPADLDPAVLDRMDEALEFPLPGPLERARILHIYLNSYIAKAGSDEGMHAPPPLPGPFLLLKKSPSEAPF